MPNFTPGGAERQALLLARHLLPLGWRPVILVVEAKGPLREEAESIGVPIHDIRGELWRRKWTPAFWLNLAGSIRRIAGACRRERACVIHSFLFWQNQLAVPAGRLAPGVGAVITGRRNTGDYKDRRRHYQPIENIANLFTDGIICNSQSVRDDLHRRERFTGNKVHVIPNAVDIRRIDSVVATDLRAVYPPLRDKTVIVGTIGNMKAQKRHDRFLEALLLARRENPSIGGVLVGRDLGEEKVIREKCTAMGLDGHLILTGGVADAVPHLKGFDLLVLSSDFEGMPNVVLEAMAAGIPVTTTEVGGVRELIRDKTFGLVVNRDAGELASAILTLAGNPGTRKRLALNARERVERDYSPEALAVRHVRIYENLTGRRGDSRLEIPKQPR